MKIGQICYKALKPMHCRGLHINIYDLVNTLGHTYGSGAALLCLNMIYNHSNRAPALAIPGQATTRKKRNLLL